MCGVITTLVNHSSRLVWFLSISSLVSCCSGVIISVVYLDLLSMILLHWCRHGAHTVFLILCPLPKSPPIRPS